MFKTNKLPKIFGILLSMILLIGLVGCSSDTPKKSSKKDSNESAIIETKFGKVEIKGQPKRIVALGWGDAETALSLGVEPIGASDWLVFGGDGVGPWLKGAYKKSPTITGTMELDYEQIASLKPDLILDVKSSGDEKRYQRLSEIAPTVGVPEGGDNWLTSTEDQVKMIAKALGKEDKGEALLKEVDDSFKKAASDNPEFANKTIAVGAKDSTGFGAYVKGDSRVDFVTRLGFKNKEEIEKLANGSFFIKVADEKLDLLDADLTVVLPIWIDPNEITKNELYQKIPSVVDGRSIILDTDSSNAFSTGTVPALLWAIDNITPQFKEVIEKGSK